MFYLTMTENRFAKENSFVGKTPDESALPTHEEEHENLPKPVWDGHDDVLACYDKAWRIAFSNLRSPIPGTGFVSQYIDTAFNGCTFMWDSVFMTMFGKYGARSFNFQGTLDNFYSHQNPDGFICREIEEITGNERFTRFDPSATGPDILAWGEWEYYKNFGDKERLSRVFPCLMAFHEWMREFHTWPDGTYWSSGWGCGMDNIPRLEPGYNVMFSHGHMVWNDACFQELMNCRILAEMAAVLGREQDAVGLLEERDRLISVVNDTLWDDDTAFYYDKWKSGKLNNVKHIGAFWALLGEAVPKEKADRFIAHLENKNEFNVFHRVPALSADHPDFNPSGGYWRGGVWAPTNYMVMCGLDRYQRYSLSHEIALNHLNNVVSVFNREDTLFENYAPMPDKDGNPHQGGQSLRDMVGWTGLVPISVLFEFVFGIKPDAQQNTIDWHVELTDRHGIEKYPFGRDSTLSLICERRNSEAEEPDVIVRSDKPVTVRVFWDNDKKQKTINI